MLKPKYSGRTNDDDLLSLSLSEEIATGCAILVLRNDGKYKCILCTRIQIQYEKGKHVFSKTYLSLLVFLHNQPNSIYCYPGIMLYLKFTSFA